MNYKQAQSLKPGDRVHYVGRGGCSTQNPNKPIVVVRYRVTGKPKTWKRDPYRVTVPVKYGLYDHAYITEQTLSDWHLESECPLAHPISDAATEDDRIDFLDPTLRSRSEDEVVECPICKEEFASNNELQEHMAATEHIV